MDRPVATPRFYFGSENGVERPSDEVTLKVAYGNTLDVFRGVQRIGSIAPSMGELWAVYRATNQTVQQRRFGTVATLELAVEAIVQHEEVSK